MTGWWLVVGCGQLGGESPPDPIPSITTVRSPLPLPAALAGPELIAPPAGGSPSPGVGRAQHLLCIDAPGARDALLTSLYDDPDAVVGSGVLDGSCDDPGWHRWVRAQLEGDDLLGALEPLWGVLEGVADPEVGAFVVETAPASRALSYARSHQGPYAPRLAAIAARLLREDGFEGRYAIAALAEIDDPGAEAALLDLYARAPAWREEVALSLWGRQSETAQRLHHTICDRTPDPRCDRERPDPLAELPALLGEGADARWLLARYPGHRSAILAAISRCAAGDGPAARGCALVLLGADPGAARLALAAAEASAVSDLHKAVLAGPDALAAALRDAGFADAADQAGITAFDRLAAAGRIAPLGAVGYAWPPHTDRLLYALAGLAGADEVAFDEVLPSPDAPTIAGRVPRVTLYAYDGGWRTRALADASIGWDLYAATGLVNAVLDERAPGDGVRLAIDVGLRHVVAGPADGLRQLAADGWLQLAMPPTADVLFDEFEAFDE